MASRYIYQLFSGGRHFHTPTTISYIYSLVQYSLLTAAFIVTVEYGEKSCQLQVISSLYRKTLRL